MSQPNAFAHPRNAALMRRILTHLLTISTSLASITVDIAAQDAELANWRTLLPPDMLTQLANNPAFVIDRTYRAAIAAYDARFKADLKSPEHNGVEGLEKYMDGIEEEWSGMTVGKMMGYVGFGGGGHA